MPIANDLLDVARDLAGMYTQKPHQAVLRRAASTAYYALFHLLVSEATLNWAQIDLRSALGRLFDHGAMRSASESQVSRLQEYFKGKPPADSEREIAENLRTVAKAFLAAQRKRQDADYNMASEWTLAKVEEQIRTVDEAFQSWSIIRNTPAAQAYLLSLLGTKGRFQNSTGR